MKDKLADEGIDYLWISDLGNTTKDIDNIKLVNERRGIEKVLALVAQYEYDTDHMSEINLRQLSIRLDFIRLCETAIVSYQPPSLRLWWAIKFRQSN